MHNPDEEYMQAVRRILSFLKSMPTKGILFSSGNGLTIEGYIDVYFVGSLIDRHYYMFLGENLVSSEVRNII